MTLAALPPMAPALMHRRALGMGLLLAVLLLALLLSIAAGASWIPPLHVLGILMDALSLPAPAGFEPRDQAVVLAIRLPRVAMAAGIGAALALSGAMLQGLFRNPLADPALIGLSSSAALGAVSTIVLGAPLIAWIGLVAPPLKPFVLPLVAFGAGLTVTLLLQRLATREGETEIATLLLAGVALSALCFAGIGFMVFLADDRQLRDITFWTLGSMGSASWPAAAAVALFLAPPLLLLPRLAATLNALILGEREAGHLGLAVEFDKRLMIVLAAMMMGASVAVSGIVGFLGLVVPHLVRLLFGADHRLVLPGAALLGAALLLLADLVARLVAAPAELPIGVVTAALGSPFFLWLLVRRRALVRG